MVKTSFGLVALVMLVCVASTGVAGAQDAYPPAGDTFVANTTTVGAGGTIVLGIQFCRPASEASFDLDSSVPLGTAIADGDGRATLNATIPSGTAPGAHTINGACTGADGQLLTMTLAITVTGAEAGGGSGSGGLPTTGAGSTIPMSRIALAAVLGGGLLVLAADRRRAALSRPERETAGV